MITESMVRGNPKEAADIIATLEQEVAALEAREAALVKALETAESWLDRWASHVGKCEGGSRCTCGLTAVQFEVDTRRYANLAVQITASATIEN